MGRICQKCFNPVVHPDRDFDICLDCLIKELIAQGSLKLPIKYRAGYQDNLEKKRIERARKRVIGD